MADKISIASKVSEVKPEEKQLHPGGRPKLHFSNASVKKEDFVTPAEVLRDFIATK